MKIPISIYALTIYLAGTAGAVVGAWMFMPHLMIVAPAAGVVAFITTLLIIELGNALIQGVVS